LSEGVKKALGANATTMFSFWPEVKAESAEYTVLKSRGGVIHRERLCVCVCVCVCV
jgi:hypothetical protein